MTNLKTFKETSDETQFTNDLKLSQVCLKKSETIFTRPRKTLGAT